LNPDAKVCELINENTKWWNNQLLELLFIREEIKMIQSIPISSTNRSDTIIWRGTANGIFSVRSAYYIQQDLDTQTMAGTSNPEGKQEVWRKLWALPVPNVEKHFMWRACTDSLPTRENLVKRNVIMDSKCFFCELEVETCSHILWQCPSARDVWSMGPPKIQKSTITGPDFMQIVESIFDDCSEEETVQFMGLARHIWLRRNEVLYGGVFTHPRELMIQTIRAGEEYKQAQQAGDAFPAVERVPVDSRWKAPAYGWVKANWDAALDSKTGRMGFGVIARDHNGEVKVMRSRLSRGFLSPFAAEAQAVLVAIQTCAEMGFSKVYMEGDAKVVIEAVLSKGQNNGQYGHVMEDIQDGVRIFSDWRLGYVRREINGAAHALAQLALSSSVDRVWCEDFPACITRIVLLELPSPGSLSFGD
jgi:ribonuclease HI